MAKALGSFGGMRKYLEKEMLSPALRGRIRYGCTHFAGMEECRVFEISVDGKTVKRFSWETVNSYFIEKGYAKKTSPMSIREYWQGFWPLLEKYPMARREEYTDQEFCAALETYRNQSIQASLSSPDPIVRMFAVLDRRVGKRAMQRLTEERESQPDWLRFFYDLRVNCPENSQQNAGLEMQSE